MPTITHGTVTPQITAWTPTENQPRPVRKWVQIIQSSAEECGLSDLPEDVTEEWREW